ncbi:MAG TPA: hypothetical protein VIO15_10350 [Bacteroidales bacterium]
MKTEKRKIRNLMTGQVIEVWPSTEHPNSSYGIPVWVDSDNNDYGQVVGAVLPLAFGFEFVDDLPDGYYTQPHTSNTVAIVNSECFYVANMEGKRVITNERRIFTKTVLSGWNFEPLTEKKASHV